MYNPFSLQDKIVLVTGASSGIGKAIALECAKMGATLIINGRNKGRLNETFRLLEGEGHTQLNADLTDDDQKQFFLESLPKIDGVIHAAGIFGHKPVQFLKKADFDAMFDINFFIPSQITISLLKSKKINNSASIVFITSISGIVSSYYGGALYSATKGALNGFIKGMALDLSPKNIRVNSVMPAMIHTDILNGGDLTAEQIENDMKKYPLNRYGKPEEVAYAAIYLLSDASSWTTGSNVILDGGRTIAY